MPKSIHLLRALLREASYLPDLTARNYFRRHIVARFKAYHPSPSNTHAPSTSRRSAVVSQRASQLHAKAQKALNYLRRANIGESPCLQKVLHFAYGRLGRRKHALLNTLLAPDPCGPCLPQDVAPLQTLYYSDKRFLRYFDAPKVSKANHIIHVADRYPRLRAVIQSQHQKGLGLHRELKGTAFKTPIHNAWHRSMPIKRARNNVKRWYAETMERLLPPLPNHEWDDMQAMITGDKPISLVKKRAPAVERNPTTLQPVQVFKTTIHDGLALDKPSRADRPAGINRPHTLNPNFMRRLYSKIFVLCCKLDYDDQRNKWIATWGEPIRRTSLKTYTVDESLFAGVDAAGHVPKPLKDTASNADNASKLPYIQPRNDKGEYVRFPFFTEYLPKDNPLRKELDAWKRKRAAAANAEGAKT